MNYFQYCIGNALAQFRRCIDATLELLWPCIGAALMLLCHLTNEWYSDEPWLSFEPILQIFRSYLQWGCNIARNVLGTDNSLHSQECSYSQRPTAGLSSSCTTYTCSQWLWGIHYSLLVCLTVTYTVKVYVKCFEQNTLLYELRVSLILK